MDFLQEIIRTLIKMIIVGAFAYGGIQFGRVLKKFMDKQKEKKN